CRPRAKILCACGLDSRRARGARNQPARWRARLRVEHRAVAVETAEGSNADEKPVREIDGGKLLHRGRSQRKHLAEMRVTDQREVPELVVHGQAFASLLGCEDVL